MTKSVRIQVFMDLKSYNDAVEIAKELNLQYKNDSDLIRKMMFSWQKLLLDRMRLEMILKDKDQEIKNKDEVIFKLQEVKNVKKN